jgi:hypothetical protein
MATKLRSLPDLPEDIILNVLKWLPSCDIISVGFCNRLLWRVIHDHTLWVKADFMEGGRTLNQDQAKIALSFLCNQTRSLYLRAKKTPKQVLLKHMIHKVRRVCPHLRTLELLDWDMDFAINDFPRKLWRLSISGSKPSYVNSQNVEPGRPMHIPIAGRRSYFFGMFKAIPRLQSLDLTDCTWVDNHSLLSLSKCPIIRELILNGCIKMGGCVAYSALAAGMGFNYLERLDVRNTLMEDVDLKNFLTKNSIVEMYIGTDLKDTEPLKLLTESEFEQYDKDPWIEEPLEESDSSCDDVGSFTSDEEEKYEEERPRKRICSGSVVCTSYVGSESENEELHDKVLPNAKEKLPAVAGSSTEAKSTNQQPEETTSDSSEDEDIVLAANPKSNSALVNANQAEPSMHPCSKKDPSAAHREERPVKRVLENTRPNRMRPEGSNNKWSVWQKFQKGGDKASGDDFEEYLEEGGRNVIILNCMSEGYNPRVYTHVDLPPLTKSTIPGDHVTDDLIRYPLPCKKLKVFSLTGCYKITNLFLQHMVHHNFPELQLLDLRGTSVTQTSVDSYLAYAGEKVIVRW